MSDIFDFIENKPAINPLHRLRDAYDNPFAYNKIGSGDYGDHVINDVIPFVDKRNVNNFGRQILNEINDSIKENNKRDEPKTFTLQTSIIGGDSGEVKLYANIGTEENQEWGEINGGGKFIAKTKIKKGQMLTDKDVMNVSIL